MLKQIKKISYSYINFNYLFKRHITNQLYFKSFGKIVHYIKIIIKNKFFHYPRLAIIETGTTCNLKCPTCPTPREYLNRPPSIMKIEDFKIIINRIKDYVHVVLLHHTNEPLLNPLLPEMIEYANKNNLYTVISTNSTMLNENVAGKLLSAGLDEIIVCLDGITKESYEAFRVGANFEEVIRNIKYFCAEKKRKNLRKPFIELQFITTKLNQDQIPEMEKFCRENPVDRLKIKSLAVVGYYYTQKERRELFEKFLPDQEGVKKRYFRNNIGEISRKKVAKCDLIKDQIAILVNGEMTLCCFDVRGEYVYGNLFEKKFKDIWQEQKNVNMRQQAERRGFELCKKCEIF